MQKGIIIRQKSDLGQILILFCMKRALFGAVHADRIQLSNQPIFKEAYS